MKNVFRIGKRGPLSVAEMEQRAGQNALRGIDYLDTFHPNWAMRIPETVDISKPECCAVAHLIGGLYHDGVRQLGIVDPESLGFYVRGDQQSLGVRTEYALLTFRFKKARTNRLRMNPRTGAANQREEVGELVGV